MSVFFSLLPIFVFGNVHCASMCGPLVMLLAKHPYKWWYFLGRTLSFAMAGLLSAEVGLLFFSFLSRYHISAAFSLIFGILIVAMGISLLFNLRLPLATWIVKRGAKFSIALSKLMTQNSRYSVLLFGASTLLLPCGQTVIVFSIIALNCSALTGALNGLLFALFTSPSLIAAMHASQLFCKKRKWYHIWMGIAVIFVGLLALLRGVADLNLIKHFVLNPTSPSPYHVVFY